MQSTRSGSAVSVSLALAVVILLFCGVGAQEVVDRRTVGNTVITLVARRPLSQPVLTPPEGTIPVGELQVGDIIELILRVEGRDDMPAIAYPIYTHEMVVSYHSAGDAAITKSPARAELFFGTDPTASPRDSRSVNTWIPYGQYRDYVDSFRGLGWVSRVFTFASLDIIGITLEVMDAARQFSDYMTSRQLHQGELPSWNTRAPTHLNSDVVHIDRCQVSGYLLRIPITFVESGRGRLTVHVLFRETGGYSGFVRRTYGLNLNYDFEVERAQQGEPSPTPPTAARIIAHGATPSTPSAGEEVSFWMTVENSGSDPHTFIAGLSVWRVGGSIWDALIDISEQITLAPGAQEVVILATHRFTSEQTGNWNYQFGLWEDHVQGTLLDKKPDPPGVLTVSDARPRPGPPEPPVPLEPGDTSRSGPALVTLTPMFRWEAVPNADRYAIGISHEPYGPEHRFYSIDTLTGTSFALPSGVLEYGKKYRWNMQAGNSEGWSEVSGVLYFQAPAGPEVVRFLDANLEAAVREALRRPTGDITVEDMRSLTEVHAHDQGVSLLVGMEHATNLTELFLGSNEISDLAPLTSLTNLTWLSLESNEISDLYIAT